MEIWKDIKNYEGIYQINNFGKIKSAYKKGNNCNNKILKVSYTYNGYERVGLSKNNKTKKESIFLFMGRTMTQRMVLVSETIFM